MKNFTCGQDIYVIYFAFATTGFLGQNGEVCQIAAMGEDDKYPLSVDVLPDGDFMPSATVYNDYTSRMGTDDLRHLIKCGVKAEICTLPEGLIRFICYVVGKANNRLSTHIYNPNYCMEFP